VNELLTQIEAFDGIFVASTNLVDTLDAASLRRFDFKIKFGYLNRSQRREFLSRMVLDMRTNNVDVDASLRMLDHLDALTPGDFANVSRQIHLTNSPATAVRFIELLAQEAAMKPEGRRRTIGFTA
jgi:SpoVK/Ycf46/Vps4 family AAA+-type ATPase